ncbi:osteoclast-stimulating factor 1-like [Daphnia pulicaria]|uniref:osteoclast-stimulating factor 1-like n=1 Tax=Daphnia pulicaria TaxID=35523 RepID=UPI001EEBF7B5|nr:osteoclast-stimulating factor 1-like [Daphnia pulicaria]
MNVPPPKPPKPGQVKVVKALYAYTAQHPDELSFEEGELLYVMESSSDPNWLKAKCGTCTGLIPCNYVEENAELITMPLHDACRRGNVLFLEEAILNGVSVNQLDKAGNTALFWAAHGGHISCMQLLLQSEKIDLNAQNKLGDTALHAATWKGRIEAVSLLLSSGAKTNILNCEGNKALALSRDPEIINMIAKHDDSLISNNVSEYFGNAEELDSD